MSDRVINSLHSDPNFSKVRNIQCIPHSPTSKVYGEEQGPKEVEDVKHFSLFSSKCPRLSRFDEIRIFKFLHGCLVWPRSYY